MANPQNKRILFSPIYYQQCDIAKTLVAEHILKLFNRVNILNVLSSGFVSVDDVITSRNLNKHAHFPLKWMMDYLEWNNLLNKKTEQNVDHYKLVDTLPTINTEETEKKLLDLDPAIKPFCDLTRKAIDVYPLFFFGKKGIDVLFADDGVELWNQYFSNTNGVYSVYNTAGAEVINDEMDDIQEQVFLELGSGGASAAISLLQSLYENDNLNRLKSYMFSDLSPILIRMGRKRLEEFQDKFAGIDFKRFNFDINFVQQGIQNNSIDLIYSVNAIHAAEDVLFTVGEIYGALKPGGKVVLSECVRSQEFLYPPQEIVFNLLDNFWDVGLSDLRPNPGFLFEENWIKIFEKVGFKNIKTVTNIDFSEGDKATLPVFAMVIIGEK